VAYLDTGCAFSASRLAQMYKHLPPGSREELCSLPAALCGIAVYRVHSIWSALHTLEALRQQLMTSEEPSVGPRVVILDSLSAIVSPVLGGRQQQQGHTLMVSLARALLFLANTFNVAVLVTNHLVNGGSGPGEGGPAAGVETELKPALGEHWRGQPQCRIALARLPCGLVHEATLLKATLGAPGKAVKFEIWEGGLRHYEGVAAEAEGYGEQRPMG